MASLLAAGLGLLLAGCGDSSGARTDDPLQATTRLGEVRGFEREGVAWFLGIPYAEPPVGELRFRPPRPAAPWSGVLHADHYGPACPQPIVEGQELFLEQSEDCLTLNVWTPAADTAQRPVMFWVHGGGWMYEGTEDPLYRGSVLAHTGDVVVVSVQYRLGALGFSELSEVPGSGAEHTRSANAGLLDQLLALEWVRDNIAAFGGDPGNVTLFGESAGASSVLGFMSMPGASGLFRRVIAQSPALTTVRTTPFAARVTDVLMENAGVSDLAGLLALDTQALLAAQQALVRSSFVGDFLFGLSVDGLTVPAHPVAAAQQGSVADVPLLIGTTRDEMRLWATDVPILVQLPLRAIARVFPITGRAIPDSESLDSTAAFYQSSRPEGGVFEVSTAVITDIFFRIPALRLADGAVQRNRSPAYVYRFDYEPPAPAWPDLDLGSPHAAELGFMFGTPESWTELYGDDPPRELVDQMLGAWLSFARNGVPSHRTLPAWQPYRPDTRPTLLFDAAAGGGSRVENDPAGSERRFWESVPFDGTRPALDADDLSG